MTLRDFAQKHAYIAKERGIAQSINAGTSEAFAKGVLRPYIAFKQRQVRNKYPAQQTLLDELRDQDRYCLLVFDAGRYDYLAPLLSDYYTGEVQPSFSAARDTFEWITKAWQGGYEDVTYISGMVPVSDEMPDFDMMNFQRLYDGINPGDNIGYIHPLWKEHWDRHVATVPPEEITDYAMDYLDQDKLVVHYNQPHSPYIGTPKLLGHTDSENAMPKKGRPNDEPIWHRVRAGEVSDAYLRMAYWANAKRAIEACKPLVKARDRVIATSDHGEALGEWDGYAHDRAPHPKRRVVPWQPIKGVDEQNRESNNNATPGVNDKLEALGYR